MLEPRGEDRADLRMARLCAVLAAVNGNEDISERDFLFKFEEEKQSVEEMKQAILSFAKG